MHKLNLRIRGRLIAGFATVGVVLAAAVGCTILVIGGVSQTVERMVNLRTPVALGSTEMVGNVYSTLATLRGYLLVGNSQGKADRAAMWKELETTAAELDKAAERFTNPENKRKWAETKALLKEFRTAQDQAEAIAFTPDAFPATKLLLTEAAPRAATMFSEITAMINEEERLEATPERKRLLKAMADTRGNFAAATAQLRLYLQSGNKEDRDRFAGPWENFQKGLAAVNAQKSLLTASQQKSFEKFNQAYNEFAPLPARTFTIRESAQWNMPVHLLVTEAAPRALKILDLLDGPKQADGTRSGGIKTNQKLMLAQEARSAEDGMSFLQRVQWILLAAGLGVAALIALLTARSISKPITGLTGGMRELASGNFDVVLPGLGRKDEIGEIAGAVEEFKIKAAEKARREAEAKQAEEARLAAQRKADMQRLANEFEKAVGNIVDAVSSASTELEAAAGTLTGTAETTQSLSTTVAAASEEASTNVQSVASAAEELAGSINEIARQVQESSKIAAEAVKQAEKTDAHINDLSQSANRIGDVVKLITSVAEQTNLLALNATIEAARAGEAGKGFAVVAQEVKALAAQTAKATDDISAQIASMQAATNESVTVIKDITGTINRISEIATAIASAVEQQGAATQEISRNVQQAAEGTSQVAASISDVNRGAGDTGSASSQVLASAQSLSSESNRLKTEVEKFLDTVRAA